ncbi:MAG: CHAT domain-containing protein [Bacteroidales bacterium]|nr:CHAT domain-containing protein [Bacteroidales bacterium]
MKVHLNPDQLSGIYINLGSTYLLLGRYTDALGCLIKAETLVLSDKNLHDKLATIYINKAIILDNQRSYSSAIEYYEKGIRIYMDQKNSVENLSKAYMNLGIVFYGTKDYALAEDYLIKSRNLKQKYNLSGTELVLFNLARVYMNSGNPGKADEYFNKSISGFINESGPDYYRLAEVYFDYALFLDSVKRDAESLKVLERALEICLKNYGEKQIYVSLAYKLIGDHYSGLNDYSAALQYYQKALIAVVPAFNNTDISSNPSVDSSLFDIRLLDNLKAKSQALAKLAMQQDDSDLKVSTMRKSLETIDLALDLIETIRNNYMTEESRIYLAGNEKETYVFAASVGADLYALTKNDSLVLKVYSVVQRSKAAILRNEITGNDLLYSAAIPDSLRENLTRLSANIAAYNKLIREESKESDPDGTKTALMKDALFEMNREKERVTAEITSAFPQYAELIRKTVPVSPAEIQKNLKSDETIIDYLLSNKYTDGKRKLYTFLISRNKLLFRESSLDSSFLRNALILRSTSAISAGGKESFLDYTSALNYMYLSLIAPVEDLLTGDNLIVIPDEETGWLTFDAFIKKKPLPGQTDFEGLPFLINDYTFSYGYSSSLIFSDENYSGGKTGVIAFSPSYGGSNGSETDPASLGGAMNEISSLGKWFNSTLFTGENATKANFNSALSEPAIFHLATHAMPDSANSRYSYILFGSDGKGEESRRLYNYEISLSRLNSPMVVLSACNSGTGTLYSGEGLMSLARGFILAGASSVIKTAWEVNDEASSKIIDNFYKYLSKGKPKNESLRLAKLDYLESATPSRKNPYYWAAYEVLGDNSPVTENNKSVVILLTIVIVIPVAGYLFVYFRRRRSFAERSR